MTVRKVPELIKITARELRQNATDTEKLLWKELRARKFVGKKFLRQYPIHVITEESGVDVFIIPDFFCKEEKMIIELDGSTHDKEEHVLDQRKEELLSADGYKILRFTNEEITENMTSLLERI